MDTQKNTTFISKPAWYKRKKFLITLLAIILLLLGGVAGWAITKNSSKHTAKTSKQTTPVKTVPKEPMPYGVVYAKTQELPPTESCGRSKTTLGLRLFGDTSDAATFELGDAQGLGSYDVNGSNIVVTTSAACGSKTGAYIWFSNDAGKTYTKLYTAEAPKSGGLGEQITSVKLSSDGKKVVFGSLPDSAEGNTVKEIDTSSGATSDLFTVKQRGTFVEGYNTATQKVYYFKGCYNCDGTSRDTLYAYDIAKKTTTVAYNGTKSANYIDMTSDFKKMLIVRGGDSMFGAPEPYVVEEVDLTTKKSQKLIETTPTIPLNARYRDAGSEVSCYSKQTSLYCLDATGKAELVFKASDSLRNIYYVGKDQIVTSAGTESAPTVMSYLISTKKSTNVMKTDATMTVLGVVTK